MKLKWRKPPTPPIDRLMATNGAHRANTPFHLVDGDGKVLARVQRAGADWRYWLPNAAASGAFPSVDAAKAAAERAVRK